MLSDYDEEKSTSISRTKRLIEFFCEDVIKDNDLCCRFVTANVSHLPGQIKFSITIIKKPSAKRKHDELNEKTLTRQWRINIQHEQQHEQSSNIYDNFQLTTKQKATFDGKIDIYIRHAPEHLHTHPWQMISYELTDLSNIFRTCYCTSIEEQIKSTQRSIGYERAIHNCSTK
ncbi:unnamed protein product, partial [Rotaria sordida]